MKRWLSVTIVAVFTVTSTGCALVDSSRHAWSESTRMFKPRPHDGPQELDSAEDEWGFVGKEARADMERERDPDRWWQNLVMSQEARNIERNLGID